MRSLEFISRSRSLLHYQQDVLWVTSGINAGFTHSLWLRVTVLFRVRMILRSTAVVTFNQLVNFREVYRHFRTKYPHGCVPIDFRRMRQRQKSFSTPRQKQQNCQLLKHEFGLPMLRRQNVKMRPLSSWNFFRQ